MPYATAEGYYQDEGLFGWVNTVTQGLAIRHAEWLGVEPVAVVVLDTAEAAALEAAGQAPPFGGTGYFLQHWQAQGRRVQLIDLAALRAQILGDGTGTARGSGDGAPGCQTG